LPDNTVECSPLSRIFGFVCIDEALIACVHLTVGVLGIWLNLISIEGFWEGLTTAVVHIYIIRPIIKIAYFSGFMIYSNGQTPGLNLVHARLVRLDGKKINLRTVISWYMGKAILRRIPVIGPAIGLVLIIMIFFSKKNQDAIDYVANVRVVGEIGSSFIEYCAIKEGLPVFVDNAEVIILKSEVKFVTDWWTMVCLSFEKKRTYSLLVFEYPKYLPIKTLLKKYKLRTISTNDILFTRGENYTCFLLCPKNNISTL